MDIVVVGHVDHGKSTIVGRLLADTHSLPEGKLEAVKANCERNSKPFEYAFLLDSLKDEQSQGITIDAARIFFKTKFREYTIIDAPGHIEFLKNMVTGASRAESALLVIDGKEGVQENSRRHGYLLSMLGVKQICVLVNKMDLLNFEQKAFDKVCAEYNTFLGDIGVVPFSYIPVAGILGLNIVDLAKEMSWYKGKTVIQTLDSFQSEAAPDEKPFRMPVQDVFKFTRGGDDRRIIAGTVESGTLKVGNEVVFYPSGKKSVVKSIEGYNREVQTQVGAREATGFTLKEQIYIARGEIAAISGDPKPLVTTHIRASLFWLGRQPMVKKRGYTLKLGTAKVDAKLHEVIRVMNSSNLNTSEEKEEIATNSVAECVIELERPIAVDRATDFSGTGRFVILDRYDISGGGLVREAIDDKSSNLRDKVILRNTKWELGMIPHEARAERFNQKATLILLTSAKSGDRKDVAKKLEAELFESGRIVYFLGMTNTLYGIAADIVGKEGTRDEALRRFAETVNVLLDAGVIVIGTVSELSQENLEIIKTTVDSGRIEIVWVGEEVTTDVVYDLKAGAEGSDQAVYQIKSRLQERGLIFNPR